jgi:hypothetical protein
MGWTESATRGQKVTTQQLQVVWTEGGGREGKPHLFSTSIFRILARDLHSGAGGLLVLG